MLFRFMILVHICAAFPLKCPEPAQWLIRAKGLCQDMSNYSCLKNNLINGYFENCTLSNIQLPERSTVVHRGFKGNFCSSEQYQPGALKFETNVSIHCIFLKSTCNEEGQVINGNGNHNTDTSCRCDHTRGYDFLVKPRHPCFCVPSEEDCSCYLKTCSSSSYMLSPDYDCIHAKNNISIAQCKPSIEGRNNRRGNQSNVHYISRRENIPKTVQWKRIERIFFSTMCFGLVFILCIGGVICKILERYYWKSYFTDEPPAYIEVTEGQTVSLMYKLGQNRFPITFLKNDQFLPETSQIMKRDHGRLKTLIIQNVTFKDRGMYSIEVAGIRSIYSELNIKSIFTSMIEPKTYTEGNQIQLTCSVYTDCIDVIWSKQGIKILQSDHFSIEMDGRQRTLKIEKAVVADSGMYSVMAENAGMKIPVTVKALFKHPLTNVTIMEGLDTTLECETEEENIPFEWFKDGVRILKAKNIKIEQPQGNMYRITFSPTSIGDRGMYGIAIKGIVSSAFLDVKEMPETIKQMSIYDREEFLKAANSGISRRYNIRVMIVGESSAGKTCLLRRLMNEPIDDVQSTDGIDIEKRNCQVDVSTGKWHVSTSDEKCYSLWSAKSKEMADCEFWDFAGQKNVYATHQTFLTANCVYLLTVDISKDFTKNTYNDMAETQFDGIGEYINFWFDNIHCYSTDVQNAQSQFSENEVLNPPVLVVGTGIDKIPLLERERRKDNFNDYLKNSLSAKRRHLRKIHCLSNVLEDEGEFLKLQNEIFHQARGLINWENNLPVRWIILEKELLRRKSEKVITYAEATNLAEVCSFSMSETSELDSFLKYEHEIGNIIFFEDLKKSFIALDPKWLVDVFRCFVSHQYQHDMIGLIEWAEFEKTGKLQENLIVKLLEKVPSLSVSLHTDFILQIMEKFDIIIRPLNENTTKVFYMPCMMRAVPLDIIKREFDVDVVDCKKTSWFCLEFNFLPPAFFNHTLVSFAKRNTILRRKDTRLSIYRNFGIFNLNDTGSRVLGIGLSRNLIAMQVWQWNCSVMECNSDIKNTLIDLVKSISLRYRINLTFEKKFKCSGGFFNDNEGMTDYDTVIENSEHLCSKHRINHSSKEIYSGWLTDEEIDDENRNKGRKKCHECMNMSGYCCFECAKDFCKYCYKKHDEKTMNSHHSTQLNSDEFLLDFKFSPHDKHLEIRDIKCIANGLLVVTLEGVKQMMTCSLNGKQKQFIYIHSPAGRIAVVDRNTVVALVEPYNKLTAVIADVHQKQVIQWVNNESISWSTLSPFIYIDNQLYVACNSEIIVTDMCANFKRRFKLSFTPTDMCYDVNSQRIYCIDQHNSHLMSVGIDGNNIFIFTDTNITNPCSISIDDCGNILVLCDKGNHSFSVIKLDSTQKSSEIVITDKKTDRCPHMCFDFTTNSVIIGRDDTVYIYKKKSKR